MGTFSGNWIKLRAGWGVKTWQWWGLLPESPYTILGIPYRLPVLGGPQVHTFRHDASLGRLTHINTPFYLELWFITAKGYKWNQQKERHPEQESRGNQPKLRELLFPVGSCRMCLIPLAMICSKYMGYCLEESLSETPASKVSDGGWCHRQSFHGAKKSAFPDSQKEREVSVMNHIV